MALRIAWRAFVVFGAISAAAQTAPLSSPGDYQDYIDHVRDPVSWGQAADGLRLGLGLKSKSDELRVAFQNVGPIDMDILLGGRTGIGPIYAMNFTATDPRGTKIHVIYTGGAGFVAGVLEPLLVRLHPGETYELLLPLDKFFCVLDGGNLTLGNLLRKGYSVRAALAVNAESAKWSKSAAAWRGSVHIWTGSAMSSDLRWR